MITNPDQQPHIPGSQSISMTELAAFAGKSIYPKEWEKYHSGQSRHAGFNGWASILGMQWFFYRKLYAQGVLSFLLESISLLLLIAVCVFLFGTPALRQHPLSFFSAIVIGYILIRVLIGFWANIALYKRAITQIRKIDDLNLNNELHLKLIASAGGINFPAALAVPVGIVILKFIYGQF